MAFVESRVQSTNSDAEILHGSAAQRIGVNRRGIAPPDLAEPVTIDA
jgi:hypothetical protein